MADLTVKKISVRNWATITDSTVEFPDYGLVLVMGNNLVEGANLEGVGAGKTSFGEAISKTILGIPDKPIGRYSRNRNGDTYVKVTGELQGRQLIIESGFKCHELSKTGEGFQYSFGSEKISRSRVNLTRDELESLIQVGGAIAPWTVYIDGDKFRFNKIPKLEQVNILMMALRQPAWGEQYRKGLKVHDHFSTEYTRVKTKHDTAKEECDGVLRDIEQARRSLADATRAYESELANSKRLAQEHQEKIDNYTSDLGRIKALQVRVNKRIENIAKQKAEKYALLESSRVEVDGLINTTSESVRKLTIDHTQKQSKVAEASKPLTRPKNCPTCGQSWVLEKLKFDSITENVAKLKDDVAEALKALNKSKAEEKKFKETRTNIQTQIGQLNVSATRLLSGRHRKLGERAEDIAIDVRQLERKISAASRVDNSKVVEAKTRVADLEARILGLQEKVDSLTTELVDSESSVNIIKYWTQAFGAGGVSNMILRDAIEPLNEISRKMSMMISGGALEVTFDTEKELADGDAKDELIIRVRNPHGSSFVEDNSKGESTLTNLIISETLAEIGHVSQAIGLSWHDEVINNLPAQVRSVVLQYLKEKAKRNGQLIFIVDHHPESWTYADHVLLAEKTKDGTTVSWQ